MSIKRAHKRVYPKDEEQKRRWESEARRLGTTFSSLARSAIESYIGGVRPFDPEEHGREKAKLLQKIDHLNARMRIFEKVFNLSTEELELLLED